MGFMKPSVGNPPKPTDARQDRGKTVNPPTYMEMGGLKGPSKVKKNSMRVEKPERGGPFTKG
jgi:hypothetical protein